MIGPTHAWADPCLGRPGLRATQPAEGRSRRIAASRSINASGSGSLPGPTARQACQPDAGSMTWNPSAFNVSMLRIVAGCRHMTSFILGASSTGVFARSIDAASSETMQPALPCASFASMFIVQGAMSAASSPEAARMCCGSFGSDDSHGLVSTGRPDKDWNTSGVTNRCASAVMETVTSAPAWASVLTTEQTLYDAIPAQTPTAIRRPLNGSRLSGWPWYMANSNR
ncbi:MAG: hypothetical protein RL591_2322 [Planctomycetota bacterium]